MPPITKPKRPASILDRAKAISFDNTAPFSMGMFGESATGKTTLWSTWPKPILAVLCSGELKTPGELRSISKKDRDGIKPIILENCEELNEITDAVVDSEYKTVVLDHLTSFSDLVLKQVLGLESIPPQLSWGFARREDWGKHGELVKTFLQRMLNLPKYTVVVSQHRWFDPPAGVEGVPAICGPASTPTISGWLVPALDYCVQTFIREEVKITELKIGKEIQKVEEKTGKIEYCAHLPKNVTKMTKFRAPRGVQVPEILVNPTFTKLQALIEGLEK